MKIRKSIYISLALVGGLQLAGCSNEVDINDVQQSAPLTVEVGLEELSRAPITGRTLPEGSIFGIVCSNNSNSKDTQIREVKYTGGESVIQGDPVILGDYEYTVGAFYPFDMSMMAAYNNGVELSALSQTDFLFGYTTGLNYRYTNAYITMKHALAMVQLNIRKDDFVTKDLVLRGVELSGVNTSGKFNPLNSTYTNTKADQTLIYKTDTPLYSGNYVTVDMMIVPTESGTATLNLNVGGKLTECKAMFKHSDWKMGYRYAYTVTISAESVTVEAATIIPWTANTAVNATAAQAAAGNAVDLGVSKLWADRNVGAYSPNETGVYGILDYQEEMLVAYWGKDWSIPSDADFAELFSKCQHRWTADGLEITGNGNTIVLPAAGYILNNAIYNYKWGGSYLSSSNVWDFSNTASPASTPYRVDALYTLRPVKSK